ncbi:biotin synthase [Peptoclostridium litorale DSM 5388]|uniref:biotin synthase n=1 Tax=Peptoclostridium litorale DSM 5388 TaxID=1121324 RepID=A0A069RHD1_PEPLI|nr:radical SAM protein [Peptoclostridium litorale]KDR95570.1 radical SAM domain-containing protein [Peptoclostridium litorale DSM 5388]SIN98507.1 biotin synthase [Peptoclostridium litorale DSM 5388]
MIRVSIGTANVLGLKRIKTDAKSTTAYLLNGQKCNNNCGFCPQARESKDDGSHLSRVVWPEYDTDTVIDALKKSASTGDIQRACIQFTLCSGSFDAAKELSKKIYSESDIPFSVSLNVPSVENARELIEAGASRISIALDAATAEIHNSIKGSDFHQKKALIEECATLFPDKISTHVIIGLGETEFEAISEIAQMYKLGVSVGLFAFTPVKGTALENQSPPDIGAYRRVQMANYLLKYGFASIEDFKFENGRLVKIDIEKTSLSDAISSGKCFETAGCKGCNRPYYNERPGGVMYNYPRPLSPEEISDCMRESSLNLL